jgi:uridine phosphorylase
VAVGAGTNQRSTSNTELSTVKFGEQVGEPMMPGRFITPKKLFETRFARKGQRPKWRIAILCFRDHKGSQALVAAVKGKAIRRKVLWAMEPSSDLPQVYEATIHGYSIGIVARCAWGGPQAAILVEELAEMGVEHLIGFGAVGSFDSDLLQGTQVVISKALPTDGTSRHYVRGVVGPDPTLAALCPDVAPVTAATIDAIYRETPLLIRAWKAKGAQVINMEATPFYAAAIQCGVKAIWLGHVSDVLVGKWKDWCVDRSEMNAQTIANCVAVIGGIKKRKKEPRGG